VIALLLIAFAAGLGAAVVVSARDGRRDLPAARIPAIPVEAADGARCPLPQRSRRSFVAAARETHLPLALLTAVARVESEFRPHAHSDEDVRAGARYLQMLFDRFATRDLALAAYDAGPSAVADTRAARRAETLTYVADVRSVWRSLAGCH